MLVVGGAFVFVCVVVCLCDGWVLRCCDFCLRMYGSGCMMALGSGFEAVGVGFGWVCCFVWGCSEDRRCCCSCPCWCSYLFRLFRCFLSCLFLTLRRLMCCLCWY